MLTLLLPDFNNIATPTSIRLALDFLLSERRETVELSLETIAHVYKLTLGLLPYSEYFGQIEDFRPRQMPHIELFRGSDGKNQFTHLLNRTWSALKNARKAKACSGSLNFIEETKLQHKHVCLNVHDQAIQTISTFINAVVIELRPFPDNNRLVTSLLTNFFLHYIGIDLPVSLSTLLGNLRACNHLSTTQRIANMLNFTLVETYCSVIQESFLLQEQMTKSMLLSICKVVSTPDALAPSFKVRTPTRIRRTSLTQNSEAVYQGGDHFAFTCAHDFTLVQMSSRNYSNVTGDRVWKFECKPSRTYHSFSTGYINEFGSDFSFSCPNDYAIVGLTSDYDALTQVNSN